jgi:phosphatidylinositol alpha-mannosyltransferase
MCHSGDRYVTMKDEDSRCQMRRRKGNVEMKIALVSPYDWSYPGGVRSHIEHLAGELRQRGHTVRILTPASGPKSLLNEPGVLKLGWAAPVRFNGSVARIGVTPAMKQRLRRLLERERFDVVHLHEPFVSPLTLDTLWLAHELDIACVATFHASSNRRASPTVMAYAMASPFLKSYFHRLDACIAVSDAARSHVARFFATEFNIIPNGIDPDLYHAGAPRLPQFDDGKRNILFLSRMEPRKGLRYLLKAIPRVRDYCDDPSLPPVRFILAGEGPERVQYQRYVAKHGWGEVVFTGYVSDAEKPAYFASADIYCAPSTGNESQGIVLLEAMASGVPVVASDIPGYRTVITGPEVGVLTPPRNAEHLAWALCHLLRDDELRGRIGQQGQARAMHYSWGQIAGDIERVYREGVLSAAQKRHWRDIQGTSVLPSFEARGVSGATSVWAISPFDENVVE